MWGAEDPPIGRGGGGGSSSGGVPREDTSALRMQMRRSSLTGGPGGPGQSSLLSMTTTPTNQQRGGGGGGAADDAQFLRIEVEALRAENQVLKRAMVDAQQAGAGDVAAVADLQQRLLRAEAENSTLHEALREAQELLEDAAAAADGGGAAHLRAQLDAASLRRATATAEVTQLYDALKKAQKTSLQVERQLQAILGEQQQPGGAPPPAERVEGSSVHGVQEYVAALRAAVEATKAAASGGGGGGGAAAGTPGSLAPPPTVRHAVGGRLRQIQAATDIPTLRQMCEDLVQELAEAREGGGGAVPPPSPMPSVRGEKERAAAGVSSHDDCELLGAAWDELLTSEERLERYRARVRQTLGELELVREENERLQHNLGSALTRADRVAAGAASAGGSGGGGGDVTPHVEQIMRELAEYRHETARLREEKQRLLQAVKQASAQARVRDEMLAKQTRALSETSSDVSYYSDDSAGQPRKSGGGARSAAAAATQALRDERDRLVDQLVGARAAAHAAELLKHDSQEERTDLLNKLQAAHAQVAELQHRIYVLQAGPERNDRAVSPFNEALMLPDALDLPDLEEGGLDVAPPGADAAGAGDGRDRVDEYALESLRHVLHQTQQLLERSDQQLLDERDRGRLFEDQLEDMRTALEKTLREGAELQSERDTLCVERDQWAQAARDADDARRKLVEHVELLQAGGGEEGGGGGEQKQAPGVSDLLREKAELLVQIDILKERLADSMEELEGARRELVGSLDARSDLQREQDKNADVAHALREAEAERDRLEQERNAVEDERKHLEYQLENANLVKKCSGERLEQMKREVDEMKAANTQLRRELEAQMKEIAFLCDTLTETSAQYEDCAQKLEQSDAEKSKLLAEKHRDLQRIEELSGKLTEVRLQNDDEACEERRQLQTEREFDALMLADRMKELQECKDEIVEVKARATKAINVLKASLQNSLLQMKSLGDEFEVERAELQESLYASDKQHREKCEEVEKLRGELSAQLRRDGNDKLREKVEALSTGLQATKESFAQQTQAYERCKGELQATRQQLSDNADFKALFKEANETVEKLTQRNKEYAAETKALREGAEVAASEEHARTKKEADEATCALRDQISHLQAELRREKDLRLRLKEQAERVRQEQGTYEDGMSGLVNELTAQLEAKGKELDQALAAEKRRKQKELDARRAGGAIGASSADGGGGDGGGGGGGGSGSGDGEAMGTTVEELRSQLTRVRNENEAREQDMEELAAELLSQREQSKELLQRGAADNNLLKAEFEEAMRVVRRIETLASAYTPTAAAAGALPSLRQIPELALQTVRAALEHMQEKARLLVEAAKEEGGAAAAEYELAKIDLSERVRRAEETRVSLEDAAVAAQAECRRYREENAAMRAENLGLSEQAAAAEGHKSANDRLREEIVSLLDERDGLLAELQGERGGQSAEVASLLEARAAEALAAERLQRDTKNAVEEAKRAGAERAQAQKVVEGVQATLRETQAALEEAEKAGAHARRERDEAGQARDRAAREASDAGRTTEEVRNELLQTKADFARLQAVCQDLDGLNAMIDETQDELVQTREQLSATRGELQRLRTSRDADLAEMLKAEREKLDEKMRVVLKEREEAARREAAAERAREGAERGAEHGAEAARIERAQLAEERAALASQVEHLQVLCDERLQQIDGLTKEAVVLRARGSLLDRTGDAVERERDAAKAELARSRRAEEERRVEAEKLLAEAAGLRSALQELERQRDEDAGPGADGFHSQLAANQEDIHHLTQRCGRAEADAASAQEALLACEQRLAEATVAAGATGEEADARGRMLEKLEDENNRLRAELAATRRELEEGREMMLALVGPCDPAVQRS